jgi:hypothetical protein
VLTFDNHRPIVDNLHADAAHLSTNRERERLWLCLPSKCGGSGTHQAVDSNAEIPLKGGAGKCGDQDATSNKTFRARFFDRPKCRTIHWSADDEHGLHSIVADVESYVRSVIENIYQGLLSRHCERRFLHRLAQRRAYFI